MKPKIFIASSTESLKIAQAVKFNLEHDAYATIWTEGVLNLSKTAVDSLLKKSVNSDFGIFILGPDDVLTIRNEEHKTTRDNIIFELGLFVGRLGMDRNFLVMPRGLKDFHLPSDLLGITPATYDPDWPDRDFTAALGSACIAIRKALKTIKIVKSRSISMLDRNQIDILVEKVEKRLAKAEHSVWISGNDCKFVAESLSAFIEDALERHVSVKIICVDPESAAAEMLPKIDPRFKTKESFVESVRLVEKVSSGLTSRYPSLFQFRYLPILPALGLFITDPGQPTGIVKFEIYTSKPEPFTTKLWKPIQSRPHINLPNELSEWRKYFIAQFENYWNLSHEP